MAWCFSTRTSVATVLTTHPCVSRCLMVKGCFFVGCDLKSNFAISRLFARSFFALFYYQAVTRIPSPSYSMVSCIILLFIRKGTTTSMTQEYVWTNKICRPKADD